MIRRLQPLLGAFLLAAATAGAQEATRPWYLYLRYGHASAEYAFASYSFGRPAAMGGIVSDAENGYDEVLGGAGINLYSAAGNGAAVYAMVSSATDSWYGVLYVLPSLTRGSLSMSAFAGAYFPLEEQGVRQAFLDPLTALWKLHPRVSAGGSYTSYAIAGAPTRSSLGPTLQLAVPSGSIALDLLRPVANTRAEGRVTLQLAF